jgi:CHAT domain-containing protein
VDFLRKLNVLILGIFSFAAHGQTPAVPAWKAYYDSSQLAWGKDWNKAVSHLRQAERFAQSDLGIYDENYLTIINDLGLAYAQARDYVNAEKYLQKSLNTRREVYAPEDAEVLRSLNNLAGLYAEQKQVQKAAPLYRKVLAAPLKSVDAEIYWSSVRNLALLYEAAGQPDSALNILDRQRSIHAQTIVSNASLRETLDLTRARIKRKLRSYEEARVILEPYLAAPSHQQNPQQKLIYIQSLQESALVDLATGLFHHAEKKLLQGVRLARTEFSGNSALLTDLLNNLAAVYEQLSIYDKALAYYHESLNLSQQIHNTGSLDCILLQNNIAGIHLKQGQNQQAIHDYEQIVTSLKGKVEEASDVFITVLNNLASAYRNGEQYAQALNHLEHAYQLLPAAHLENDDLAATVMNNLAVVLTTQGKLEEAIVHYQKAYDMRKKLYGDNSVLLMDMAGNMAVVYWALRQPQRALPLFRQSVSLAVRQINYVFPNLNEDEQVQFYKKLKQDFERFNTIAYQAAGTNPEMLTQVFDNQITIKSLLFFTQQHRNTVIREQNDTLLSQQNELLKTKRQQLGYLYQLPLQELSRSPVTPPQLEDEISKLEKIISLKTSETLAEKMRQQHTHWADVQAALKPEEALIEVIRFRKYDLRVSDKKFPGQVRFGFTDSIYYAALITTRETTQHPQIVVLKEGKNMESRFLNYYRNSLTYQTSDENTYPYYWKPFETFIQGKTIVYFSGDGVYHQINVNTLQGPGTGQYILQRYDVHYLLNPAQVLQRRTSLFARKQAVLMGDPQFDLSLGDSKTRDDDKKFSSLPGTHAEIVKIDEILKNKAWTTNVFLKRTATEKNLKSVHSPAILHIATHGFFSADKVALSAEAKKDFLFHSGLILSGANKSLDNETPPLDDDGILTAYEVMNLDLSKTDLVVLSACETGLGKIENGEGVYGLQRSFLQAGARGILISLWKIDDLVTQELMIKLYQYLFQGKTEQEALKLAQLDLIQKNNAHPVLWGGFILMGMD